MGKFRDLAADRLFAKLSGAGLLLGAAGFLAALTPSLIPRSGAVQGAVAGLASAGAYGLGAGSALLLAWLGVPALAGRAALLVRRAIFSISALLILIGLFMARDWQNATRTALGLSPVESARPLVIAVAALAVFLLLLFLGRVVRLMKDIYILPLQPVLPARLTFLLASSLALWSVWALGDGLLQNVLLRSLDSVYREIDAVRGAEQPAPSGPLVTGGPSSLVSWESLGAEGRDRVLSGPTAEEIAMLSGASAMTPLRVYVGLNSAENAEARAKLALAELVRIGAFDRKLLVIATPTGTGWVDPAAMMPLEILHRGDVATVSVQYSYLPSWLSLLVEPEYGAETAKAVFQEVYGYWHALPKDSRPKLYLFGLSLGALNSDLSSDAFDIVGDPYDGAFWVGPPFASRTWREVAAARMPSSPWWLPQARNTRLFRFITNKDTSQLAGDEWGSTRVLYLQYPSDPIVFFEIPSWKRRPQWFDEPRAPDVPPDLVWIPGVTCLQLIVDMMTATTVPKGVGHVYASSDYLAGWLALTTPEGWDDERQKALQRWLNETGL